MSLVEDRARGRRTALTAVAALVTSICQYPRASVTALGAYEPLRPTQPVQIVLAVRVRLRPRLELAQGPGVGRAAIILRLNEYPTWPLLRLGASPRRWTGSKKQGGYRPAQSERQIVPKCSVSLQLSSGRRRQDLASASLRNVLLTLLARDVEYQEISYSEVARAIPNSLVGRGKRIHLLQENLGRCNLTNSFVQSNVMQPTSSWLKLIASYGKGRGLRGASRQREGQRKA